MICCTSSERYDPLEGEEYDLSPYPATRREKGHCFAGKSLIQTEGNALLEYDPVTMSNLVRVTVPDGLLPGMMMQVVAPDNTERIAYVTIPMHLKSGSTFLMKFPSVKEEREASSSLIHDALSSKFEDLMLKEEKRDPVESITDAKIDDDWNIVEPPEERLSEKVRQDGGGPKQKLLVSVPPGVVSGTEIYVKIPGDESRVLPVKVPKGVSKFYVSFIPQHTRHIEDFNLDDESDKNLIGEDNAATKDAVTIVSPGIV